MKDIHLDTYRIQIDDAQKLSFHCSAYPWKYHGTRSRLSISLGRRQSIYFGRMLTCARIRDLCRISVCPSRFKFSSYHDLGYHFVLFADNFDLNHLWSSVAHVIGRFWFFKNHFLLSNQTDNRLKIIMFVSTFCEMYSTCEILLLD